MRRSAASAAASMVPSSAAMTAMLAEQAEKDRASSERLAALASKEADINRKYKFSMAKETCAHMRELALLRGRRRA